VKHEELPPEHKASYRINGIDPDTLWTLVWSFDDLGAAEAQLKEEQGFAAAWQTFKIVDGGQAEVVERAAWF